VEEGVNFVEVLSTGSVSDQGWDTHARGFAETPNLCGEVDPAYSTLLCDLEDRGMLENTLVVWMGEFGRTPKLKPDGGRDHYATGWLTGLSGCGVRGGQVIGATDADGVDITDRPVGVQDLFVSFCHVLGMDPREEYVTQDGRPIKLVDGGELVGELFS
jgi:arylsulfatase A-like enzyme